MNEKGKGFQGLEMAGATEEIARGIVDALQGIRFGSVEIVIHDSKVVQIERKEKIRIARPLRAELSAADATDGQRDLTSNGCPPTIRGLERSGTEKKER